MQLYRVRDIDEIELSDIRVVYVNVHDQLGTGISFDVAIEADIETIEEGKYCNEDESASQWFMNEMIIAYNTPDDLELGDGGNSFDGTPSESENSSTIILDAICTSQNIGYSQDVKLLNGVRENMEVLIDRSCHDYHYYKPHMYRKNARRDYLSLAKCKKRTTKKICKAIRRSYVRPIVCGKAAAPVEFGTKLDLSIGGNGMARLGKLSFDTYNESDVLIGAIERYRERTGHYPKRAFADKIYRNQKNLAFCKQHGIWLSGPLLG